MSDFPGDPGRFPTPPPPPPNMTPPPGYVSYGGNTMGAFGSFREISGVAKWLGICITVLIPLSIIGVIKSFSDHGKARDFIEGRISEDDYKATIGLSTLIGGLSSALVLAIAVLTIIWMFRMAKNQQVMGRMGTWKPGWAIGGWFVPPMVLYIVPYLMFRDLWKSSDPNSDADWRRNRVGGIVTAWWVLYGLAPIAFFTAVFGNFEIKSTALEAAKKIDDQFGITLASSLVQILAAIVFLLLVRQLTERHKQTTNEG
jgi:hypothetical protein